MDDALATPAEGTRRLSVLSEHLQNLHTLKSFKSNADDVNNVASCARTWIAAVHSTRLPVLPEWKKEEQRERGGKEDPSSGLSNDKLAIYDKRHGGRGRIITASVSRVGISGLIDEAISTMEEVTTIMRTVINCG